MEGIAVYSRVKLLLYHCRMLPMCHILVYPWRNKCTFRSDLLTYLIAKPVLWYSYKLHTACCFPSHLFERLVHSVYYCFSSAASATSGALDF